MNSDRLKALTDGVIAVVITIMVLEIKPPESTTPEALLRVAPVFLSYVLSFVYVAIYWNNHHHFFALIPQVDGGILQAAIIRAQGAESALKRAIGGDWKGKLSPFLYAAGIATAFTAPALAAAIYAGVALIWLTPDRRVGRLLQEIGSVGNAPDTRRGAAPDA